MQVLFDSENTLMIQSGFIYLPLPFDPSVDEEIKARQATCAVPFRYGGKCRSGKSHVLIQMGGKYFVKGLSIASFVENYSRVYAHSYQQLKNTVLRRYIHLFDHAEISINTKLETILFQIMPHFIKRKNKLKKRPLSTEEILDLVGEKVSISEEFYKKADEFLSMDGLEELIKSLQQQRIVKPPAEGVITSRELHRWVEGPLTRRILEDEKKRIMRWIREREQFAAANRRYIATLLCIAKQGSFEREGFGFYRIGLSEDYIVYKRTGEYALKDFYGRTYLFPDCRVGVSTYGYLKPMVLDKYKHPFLEDHLSHQEICLGWHNNLTRLFSAKNVIRALEDGLNTLYYGYNSRKRNGYHSLDPSRMHFRSIDFDDYRISSDHPLIASGKIEVKNAFK